jgi:hypothetical protein
LATAFIPIEPPAWLLRCDSYFTELVRYIHLNPLREDIVLLIGRTLQLLLALTTPPRLCCETQEARGSPGLVGWLAEVTTDAFPQKADL